MAVAIPSDEKECFIDTIQAFSNVDAQIISSLLVNYEDIPNVLRGIAYIINNEQQLLTTAMECFDADALLAAKIYFDITTAEEVDNPVLIVNCDLGEVSLDGGETPLIESLLIYGVTVIDLITVEANNTVKLISVGARANVKVIDVTGDDSVLKVLSLDNANNTGAIVDSAKIGSVIRNVVAFSPSIFGGVIDDPTASCADPVTALTANDITRNSVRLAWTLPGSYLAIRVYFRRKNIEPYRLANISDGIFIYTGEGLPVGFTFNNLLSETYYDFEVITLCDNGGVSSPATVTAQTTSE